MTKSFRRRFKNRRFWYWSLGLVLGLTLFGTLVLPWTLRRVIMSQGTKAIGREVTLESISLNPFEASVTLKDLRVKEKDGSALLGFEELYVNVDTTSLWGSEWRIDEFRLVRPQARVIVRKDGSINLADLIPPAEPAKVEPVKAATQPKTHTKPVHVAKFAIIEASSNLTDQATQEPFDAVLGPLTIRLNDIGTVPSRSGKGELTLRSSIGESFTWKGRMQAEPLESEGSVIISNLDLMSIRQYFQPGVGFKLSSGKLNLRFDYHVNLEGELKLKLSKGVLSLDKIALNAPSSDQPFASLDQLELSGMEADLVTHQAGIAQIRVVKPFLAVTRRADASLDVIEFIQTRIDALPHMKPAKIEVVSASATPAPQWTLSVPSIEVSDARFGLLDQTTKDSAKLDVNGLGLKVQGFKFPGDCTVDVSGSAWLLGSGAASWAGKVGVSPISADMQLKLEKLSLTALTPYLREFVDLELSKGDLSVDGHLNFAFTPEGRPKVLWEGSLGLANLAAAGPKQDPHVYSAPRMSLGALSFEGCRVSTEPLSASINRILVRDPKLHATVLPDKSIDWLKLLKKPAPASGANAAVAAQPAPAVPAAPLPEIKIARVDIEGLSIKADDYTAGLSANPTFGFLLDGSIAGLSTEQLSHAELDLRGEFCGAPLSITGQVNPLAKDVYSKLAVKFTDFELPSVSPYAERYIGYTINQGKLIVDLNYTLSADMLEAENHVSLDRFYLGAETPGPEVNKLPYKLGLALLRDRNGRIDIDMPIRGNLKDPDFKYGKFVWRTLGSMLVKAAASPFKLLAGLAGSDADLSQVQFNAGSAELGADMIKTLDALGKALQERPGLKLEVLAQTATAGDRQRLRELVLEKQLKEMLFAEIRGKADAPLEAAAVVLTPEDKQRLIAKLYVERFHGEVITAAMAQETKARESEAAAVKTEKSEAKPLGFMERIRQFFAESRSGGNSTQPSGGRLAVKRAGASSAVTPKVVLSAATASVQAPAMQNMEERLLEGVEPNAEELRRLSARRALRVKAYLEGQKKIDPSRVFLVDADDRPEATTAASPLVKFRLN